MEGQSGLSELSVKLRVSTVPLSRVPLCFSLNRAAMEVQLTITIELLDLREFVNTLP